MPDQSFTFANFDLWNMGPRGVYGLSDELLPEMARVLGYDLGEQPTEEALKDFIKHIGPAKLLRDNIARAQQLLGTNADATTIAADWVDRSGILQPLSRSFANPAWPVRQMTDVAVITGGVARWMSRRAERLVKHIAEGNLVTRTILVGGNRVLGHNEHPLVAAYNRVQHRELTEADFLDLFIAPWLRSVGLKVDIVPVPSGAGSDVMAAAAERIGLDKPLSVLLVGNAPAGVMLGGQLRKACRAINPGFDRTGNQMFILNDAINVARNGEGPETHQNPLTGLGQLVRNALALFVEQEAYARMS